MNNNKIRVLLVDKNDTIRDILRGFIHHIYKDDNSINLELVEADNVHKAVEYSFINSFHLILMDIIMPFMNEFEMLKHIQDSSKNTVFMVISDSHGKQYINNEFKNGIIEHIPKPLDLNQLVTRLDHYFDSLKNKVLI